MTDDTTMYVAVRCNTCRDITALAAPTTTLDGRVQKGDYATCHRCGGRDLQLHNILCPPAKYRGGAVIYEIRRWTASRAVRHVQGIGKDDEWETPYNIYREAVMWAGFVPRLDVAATYANAKCQHYITAEEDALSTDWKLDWWCNPPYSKVAKFVAHAIEQCRTHEVRGIMLTYAKTDVKWWHTHVEGNPDVRVKFLKGRVSFLKDGKPMYPALYPSALLRVGRP